MRLSVQPSSLNWYVHAQFIEYLDDSKHLLVASNDFFLNFFYAHLLDASFF
jgi:hypothetical protein